MVAFGPFVPCVDEDEILLRRIRFEAAQHLAQPAAVFLGRGIVEQEHPLLAPRRVVPRRRHRRVKFIIGSRTAQAVCDVGVVIGFAHLAAVAPQFAQVVHELLPPRTMLPEIGHRRSEGLELDRSVESDRQLFASGGVETLHAAEIEFHAAGGRLLAPHLDRAPHVGEERRTVDGEDRFSVDTDVARIAEYLVEQIADVRAVVLLGVLLPDQYLLLAAVPRPRPVLVGPAEHEGEIGLPRSEHLLHGTLHQPVTVEPIVIVTESRQPVAFSQRRLLLAHFGHTQVVEPEIGRQVGLVMPPKERPCLHHVAPLRESGAPPPVVLRERVVLRQVEGDDSFGMLLHTIRFSGALRRAARSVRSDRQHRVSCAFRNSDSIRKNSNLIRIFGYSRPQEPVAKSFYFRLAVGFREFRDACRQAMQSFSPRGTRDRIFSYFCAR